MDREKLGPHLHRLYSILSKGKLAAPLDVDAEGDRPSSVAPPPVKPMDDDSIDGQARAPVSGPREEVPASPISPEEKSVLGGLALCQFKVGSADRQFCRQMWEDAKRVDGFGMTEGQHAYLWRLAYRYRHQLSAEVNAIMEARLERLRRARLPAEPLPP